MKTKGNGAKRKPWKIALLILLVLVLGFGGFVLVDNLLYMREMTDKERNLLEFRSPDGAQEVFILGTSHGSHFRKKTGYSLADIQNAIDNVKPDRILVEARPETLEQYGALDGPPEMIFAWCYASETGIPVAGIDFWKIEPGAHANSTNDDRDDRMFENIQAASAGYSRVLVLCGATHRINQGERFSAAGWEPVKMGDTAAYFVGVTEENFVYPATMRAELEKKIAYCGAGILDEINAGGLNEQEHEQWLAQAEKLASSLQETIDKLVEPNKLYWD